MKLLLAICGIAVLSGCSTASRMDVEDLNYFRVDCSRRHEQLAFLERQMPSQSERYINGMRMTSPISVFISVVDGTYYESRAMYNDRQQDIARTLIYQIKSHCPELQAKPQGCTHISESFPSGSAQGALCYQRAQSTPVVSRWEVN